jgi:LacI family transcriptional regulator
MNATDRDARTAARATIHDVARMAGVSIGTVSRALNRPDAVAPETRSRIEAAVIALGYRANAVAQSMRTQTTHIVALLVHDIANPIFIAAAQAAQRVLSHAGYLLVLASTDPWQASEAPTVRLLNQRRVDGLIGFLRSETDPEIIAALQEFEGAIVLFDRDMDVRADTVLTDHAGGIRRATRHLLYLGHRRIAFICGASDILPGRERMRGFREAFAAYGAEVPQDLVRDQSLESAYGFREASSLLRGPAQPTAILAAGNQLLEGTLEAVKEAAIDIPTDLSVIGFDDSALARLSTPPITIVRRNLMQMGTMAAEILIDRLKSGAKRATRRIVLPTELLLRDSCGPPRTRGFGHPP